jgi:hypothetical protein
MRKESDKYTLGYILQATGMDSPVHQCYEKKKQERCMYVWEKEMW